MKLKSINSDQVVIIKKRKLYIYKTVISGDKLFFAINEFIYLKKTENSGGLCDLRNIDFYFLKNNIFDRIKVLNEDSPDAAIRK